MSEDEQLEEEADDEGATYRASSRALSADDRAECERFGAIAGTFMLEGARAADAWTRANRWLDDHPDGTLPPGVELPKAPAPPPERPPPPTPLELLFYGEPRPPAPVIVVPADRRMCGCGHEGSDHVAGGGCRICVRSKLGDGCTRFHERRARAKTTRETTLGEPTTADIIMKALEQGPASTGELVEKTKLALGSVSSRLSALRKRGILAKAEGYGGDWSLTNGAAVPSKASAGRAGGLAAGRARAAKAPKVAGGGATGWLSRARNATACRLASRRWTRCSSSLRSRPPEALMNDKACGTCGTIPIVRHATHEDCIEALKREVFVLRNALRQIGRNTSRREPLAAAFAKGTLESEGSGE